MIDYNNLENAYDLMSSEKAGFKTVWVLWLYQ